MRKIHAFIACAFLGAASMCAAASDPLTNPALPPVQQKTPEKHDALNLIENGELRFAIVADRKSEKGYAENKSVTLAADFLADAVEKCTGKKPEIFEIGDAAKADAYKYKVILGTNELTKAMGLDGSKMPEEGFQIKTFPGGVAIVGYDISMTRETMRNPLDQRASQTGTLYGVIDFCERFLGVRTFYPGEYGSLYPKTEKLSIAPTDYSDYPRFADRDPCWMVWAYNGKKNQEKWAPLLGEFNYAAPNGMRLTQPIRQAKRTSFFASHNPSPHKFIKAYPDKLNTIFYRAPNGSLYFDDKNHEACYFDITNLEFADLLVESLKKYYASNGKENDGWHMLSDDYISFGQCDTEIPLRDMVNNPVVKKYNLIPEGSTEYNNIYARFYQYLAGRIKKEFPEKKLLLLPYANYTRAPTDPRWTLPDNVELRVCFYGLSTIHNPKTREEWLDKIKEWSAALGNRPVASLWLYNIKDDEFARAVVPGFTGEVAKLLGKYLGRQDLFLDQYGSLEPYYYIANYAANRSMWNPDFNVEAAVEEHWAPFYGKAAPYLKEFYGIILSNYIKYYENGQKLYPLTVYDKLESLLKDAEASLEPDSVEMKRFKVFAAPWSVAIQKRRNQIRYERPVYGIYQLLENEKIAVDGKLDEAVWSKIKPMPLRDPKGSSSGLKFPADLKMAWDKNGIYGGYRFPYAPLRDPEKAVWNNCNVEIFLSPGMKKELFYHYAIDSMNNKHIGYQGPKPLAYNGKWQSPGLKTEVTVTPEGWNLEFFIPFDDLKLEPPKAYDSWLANIVRNKLSEPKEYSGNSLSTGNNHNIDMYGIIKFMGKGE